MIFNSVQFIPEMSLFFEDYGLTPIYISLKTTLSRPSLCQRHLNTNGMCVPTVRAMRLMTPLLFCLAELNAWSSHLEVM